MQYINHYDSPLGKILLSADEIGLTGLWFYGQKYFALNLDNKCEERSVPIFDETKRWLDCYFSGNEPKFMPQVHFIGTPFQIEVWNILKTIPYGKIITYGNIAKQIAAKRKIKSMSSQAVGGAVGHNRISIIIPCHRVIGAHGSLTGYAGGIDRKIKLLELENIDIKHI